MTPELREQIIKRFKSFAWRMGSYVVVAGLAAIPDFLGLFSIDPSIIAVVALICGELTKFVNSQK